MLVIDQPWYVNTKDNKYLKDNIEAHELCFIIQIKSEPDTKMCLVREDAIKLIDQLKDHFDL